MIDTENMDFLHRTWVEIDLDRLEGNYRRMQSLVGDGCRILCVVKANAYGHDDGNIAPYLESQSLRCTLTSCFFRIHFLLTIQRLLRLPP